MTMKEFKKYLEEDIKAWEYKLTYYQNTSRYNEAVAVVEELKDIKKVINS